MVLQPASNPRRARGDIGDSDRKLGIPLTEKRTEGILVLNDRADFEDAAFEGVSPSCEVFSPGS